MLFDTFVTRARHESLRTRTASVICDDVSYGTRGLTEDLPQFTLRQGGDTGDGAVLAGETMPEPSEYLSEVQRDGKPLGADIVYRETWQWLD